MAKNKWKYVPFTCFLRITPSGIKHFEIVRAAEKQATIVQAQLESFCGASEENVFDFTKPIAYTPQFGQKTARLAFSGNLCRRLAFTKTPVGQRYVDADNGIVYGPGAANAANSIPDPELDEIVKDFKIQVEALTSLRVIRIVAAGVIYGQGGVHFPA
jgi:hypothetical protein